MRVDQRRKEEEGVEEKVRGEGGPEEERGGRGWREQGSHRGSRGKGDTLTWWAIEKKPLPR